MATSSLSRSFRRTAVDYTLGRDLAQRRPVGAGAYPASDTDAVFEKNSFSFHVRATTQKKIAYFRRVITAIVRGIQSKEDFSVRREMMLQVAQEEVPFCRSPPFLCRMIKIKIRRECRDKIELLTEVRQWFESVDLVNNTLHAEQLHQFAE